MAYKVINNTDKVKKMLAKNIINALNAVGFFIEGEAKRKVVVDKGILREDIKKDIDIDKKIARIGVTKKYGVYVEKGTGIFAVDNNGRKTPWVYFSTQSNSFVTTYGQKPQPFLTPAAEENIDTLLKIISNNLKEGF